MNSILKVHFLQGQSRCHNAEPPVHVRSSRTWFSLTLWFWSGESQANNNLLCAYSKSFKKNASNNCLYDQLEIVTEQTTTYGSLVLHLWLTPMKYVQSKWHNTYQKMMNCFFPLTTIKYCRFCVLNTNC